MGHEFSPSAVLGPRSYALDVLNLVKKTRMAALVLTLIAIVLSTPTAARAIGFLVTADPGIGQQLQIAPRSVALEFSVASLPTSFSGNVIRVTNSAGKPVELGTAKTSGSSLTVGLQENLPPDVYQVAFRYVCDDGHVLVSAYNFTVLHPTESVSVPTPTTKSPLQPGPPGVKPTKSMPSNPNSSPITTTSSAPKPTAKPSQSADANSSPSPAVESKPVSAGEPLAATGEPAAKVGNFFGIALLGAVLLAGVVIFTTKRKK